MEKKQWHLCQLESSSASAFESSDFTSLTPLMVALMCMELWHAFAGPLISLPKKLIAKQLTSLYNTEKYAENFKLGTTIWKYAMTEDDPAETKLGMLLSSSPRQTEDPSGPETTSATSSLWSS
uniref:Uncharacterized protein n=1 Tax=Solanum tuberosum TaxID=4113 RepID=M1C6X6_SOLTU